MSRKGNKSTVNIFARASADQARVAPSRFLLWAPGELIGDFGRNVWDADAARMVMEAYKARGNRIPIDIEHNTNPKANPDYDPANPPEGGGYVDLVCEWKDDGPYLWLDPIEWSDLGRREVETGSRRYFSPDWDYDTTTGRPVQLNVISLVQRPGTYNARLIASASPRRRVMDETMRAALEAIMAIQDPAEKDKALKAFLEAHKADGQDTGVETTEMAGCDEDKAKMMAGEMTEEKMAKAIAMAMKALGVSPKASATASAPKTSVTEDDIRRVVQVEFQRSNAIASARKAGKVIGPKLAADLMRKPVSEVKAILDELPVVNAPAATTAPANATASAGQGPVKVGPWGGQGAGEPVSPEEQAYLDAIGQMGKTRKDLIESAKKANATAGAGGNEGRKAGTFDPFSQVRS